MGRILALDCGQKRTGVAVTDVLQIVPGGLCTISTNTLLDFLTDYLKKENVDTIVIGYPKQMDNTESESMKYIKPLINKIKQLYPDKEIVLYDERFTSKIAQATIRTAGIKKKRRQQDKGLVDEVSAVLILQSYMTSKINNCPTINFE